MRRIAMLLCALALVPAEAESRQATLAADGATSPRVRASAPMQRGTAPVPRDPLLVADSIEIRGLAKRLTRDAATDSAKAASLYEWVARNIAYDVAHYRRRHDAPALPEHVYRERRALCGGFVQLYERMAKEAGLNAVIVNGYAKGFDYVQGNSADKSNHAWLAVWLNGGWRLIDPTWGAGALQQGRFVPQFSWDYFMVNPDVLLLSHYPEEEKWQLVSRPLRRSEFERMPLVPRNLFGIGFSASAIRKALESKVRDFPLVGVTSPQVKVVDAPIAGTLRRSAAVPVRVRWPNASDVALVTGGKWIPLARAGDIFHGQVNASAGELYLVGRASPAQPYHTLLMYRVD